MVDDELFNLQSMIIYLKLAFKKILIDEEIVDFIVDTANNGKEALDKVTHKHTKDDVEYGLIFMDWQMPIMDGLTASQEIRKYYDQEFIDQPLIIACTGN